MKNESERARLQQLQKMLESAGGDVFVVYAMGLEHQKLNEHEQAALAFEKAIQKDGNYLAAYYQKAISLSAIDQIQEALNCLELGVEAAQTLGDTKSLAELKNLHMNLLLELD